MIKLGIAPINWSNDDDYSLGADISFEQCLDEMQQAGFVGCEAGHKFPQDTTKLKQELTKRNLELASKWFSAYVIDKGYKKNNIDDFKRHLDYLGAMSCQQAVVCECSYSTHSNPNIILNEKPIWNKQELASICEYLNKLGDIANSYKINLVYHQHMGTGVQTEQELINLLDNTESSLVKLLLDTGHLVFAGGNINNLLDKYIDRISHVHFKDIRADVLNNIVKSNYNISFLAAVKQGVFTVPGDGCIDFSPQNQTHL
jgi:inosose dehydratase